jgi:hypothetical protein
LTQCIMSRLGMWTRATNYSQSFTVRHNMRNTLPKPNQQNQN